MDSSIIVPETVREFQLRPKITWLLAIPILLLLFILFAGFKTVNAYEACLLVRNGTIREDWGAGLHWHFPIGSDVTCYRTARTTLEASPGQAGAGAEFNDDAVSARSSDGQIIDAVSYRIAFSTPVEMVNSEGDVVNPDNHVFIYTSVGAKTQQAIVDQVVSFYARPEVRAVIQLHTSEELLTGDLSDISLEIEERLRPKLEANGVRLESFVLSKPDFNDTFEAQLQQREEAAHNVEIARQNALVAEQDGIARVNAANADAEVARIAADAEVERAGIAAIAKSERIGIAAVAEADRTRIQAQADADALVTKSNAEATAVALQVEALGGPEAYLQALQIEAMSEWPVQFIGDSSSVPIIQLTQPTPVPGE
ncbi:MAG: SPFH domain-containing protein [Thermomicrobiales bacterium]